MASFNKSFQKLLTGAGFSFAGQIISTGFKYFTQVTFAWLLGTELFGLYTLGLVFYQFGDLFSRIGLEIGAVRYVSIHNAAGDTGRLKGVLLQSIGLPFFNGIVLGIFLFLTSDFIAGEIFNQPALASLLRLFAIAIPFGASMTAGVFASTGFQTIKYRVYVWDILVPFANLLLAILLSVVGLKLLGVTLAWLLSLAIGLGATVYFLNHLFPEILNSNIKPIFESKQLIKFSLPLSFGTFLWFLLIWTDILMLGYFQSASEVGIYRAASQTAFLMILFTRSIVTIFSPMIATLYSQGKLEEVGQLFNAAARWNFTLTLPIFIIVAVGSKELLRLFGTEFVAGSIPLIILAAGQLAKSGAGGLSMHMLTMSGHQYLKLYGDLALAFINIILNTILIPRWGSLGASIATAVSIAGINFMQVAQVYRILGFQAYNSSYMKVIGAGLIAALGGFAVKTWLSSGNFLISLVVTTVTIVLIYGVLLLTVGLEDEERVILDKIRNRLSFLKR